MGGQMIGCDIIEIQRIQNAFHKLGDRFAQRILTPNEMELFIEHNRRISFLAGRFAAKESISKTLQTGFTNGVTFHSMEILPMTTPVPMTPQVTLTLSQKTETVILSRLMAMPANEHLRGSIASGVGARIMVDVSISHCRTYAVAVSRATIAIT